MPPAFLDSMRRAREDALREQERQQRLAREHAAMLRQNAAGLVIVGAGLLALVLWQWWGGA